MPTDKVVWPEGTAAEQREVAEAVLAWAQETGRNPQRARAAYFREAAVEKARRTKGAK